MYLWELLYAFLDVVVPEFELQGCDVLSLLDFHGIPEGFAKRKETLH